MTATRVAEGQTWPQPSRMSVAEALAALRPLLQPGHRYRIEWHEDYRGKRVVLTTRDRHGVLQHEALLVARPVDMNGVCLREQFLPVCPILLRSGSKSVDRRLRSQLDELLTEDER